jgi:hypothetical protein
MATTLSREAYLEFRCSTGATVANQKATTG